MKNLLKTLLLLVLLTVVVSAVIYLFTERPNMVLDKQPSTAIVAKECVDFKGNWLQEYNECEYTSEYWCNNSSGRFNECESACRHSDNPAAPCTMQCVPVCRF